MICKVTNSEFDLRKLTYKFTLIYKLVISRPSSHLLREIEALFTDDVCFHHFLR